MNATTVQDRHTQRGIEMDRIDEAVEVLALVNEHLTYCPDTGAFRHAKSGHGRAVGCVIAPKNRDGYINIQIGARTFKAHRLAWLITYGRWPTPWTDHINGDRADNRIANLRECTPRQNGQNRSEHRNGALVGASYVKKNNTWSSRIRVNGRRIVLGHFKTQREAHEAYLAAAAIYAHSLGEDDGR